MKQGWVRAVAVGGTVVLMATLTALPASAQFQAPKYGNGRQDFVSVAGCGTSHELSEYLLDAEAVISMLEREAQVTSLEWTYKGSDPIGSNIPTDAKNNVRIKLMTGDGSHTLISWSSADNQLYYIPGDPRTVYELHPNWNVSTAPGAIRMIRFLPDFDKRNVEPDPHCQADTPPFNGARAAKVDVD